MNNMTTLTGTKGAEMTDSRIERKYSISEIEAIIARLKKDGLPSGMELLLTLDQAVGSWEQKLATSNRNQGG